MDRQGSVVHHRSSPESKIALFRSLFQGREDVYPRRFENPRTGKSGYAPACGNEWVWGLCEKPKVKCAYAPINNFYLSPTTSFVGIYLAKMKLAATS